MLRGVLIFRHRVKLEQISELLHHKYWCGKIKNNLSILELKFIIFFHR